MEERQISKAVIKRLPRYYRYLGEMLNNGVDVRTLQEVLGHENLNTTQIYTHVDNSGLRVAAASNPLASFHTGEKSSEEDSKSK